MPDHNNTNSSGSSSPAPTPTSSRPASSSFGSQSPRRKMRIPKGIFQKDDVIQRLNVTGYSDIPSESDQLAKQPILKAPSKATPKTPLPSILQPLPPVTTQAAPINSLINAVEIYDKAIEIPQAPELTEEEKRKKFLLKQQKSIRMNKAIEKLHQQTRQQKLSKNILSDTAPEEQSIEKAKEAVQKEISLKRSSSKRKIDEVLTSDIPTTTTATATATATATSPTSTEKLSATLLTSTTSNPSLSPPQSSSANSSTIESDLDESPRTRKRRSILPPLPSTSGDDPLPPLLQLQHGQAQLQQEDRSYESRTTLSSPLKSQATPSPMKKSSMKQLRPMPEMTTFTPIQPQQPVPPRTPEPSQKQTIKKSKRSKIPNNSGWSKEDDELIVRYKEVDGLSWKKIADLLNQRHSWQAIQMRYLRSHKSRNDSWSRYMELKLVNCIKRDWENRWKRISEEMSSSKNDDKSGITVERCQNKNLDLCRKFDTVEVKKMFENKDIIRSYMFNRNDIKDAETHKKLLMVYNGLETISYEDDEDDEDDQNSTASSAGPGK